MLKDMKPRKILALQLTKKPDELAVPKDKFTNESWDANNRLKLEITRVQTQLAKCLIDESERVIEEVTEDTKAWQREVDHQLRERADEVDFLTDELNKQRKTALMEEEALTHYRNRISKAMEQLKNALNINHECIKLRANRIGVDLCSDDVEIQLAQELKILKGCENMMNKTYQDATQQLQRLRGAIYLLDKDIEQKSTALRIDGQNLLLKETMSNLVQNNKLMQPQCNYSLDEWQRITTQNIDFTAKELNSATQLRGYIDLLLRQICEDLQNQTERTNEAYRRRIRETREIKHLLEAKHSECSSEIIKLNSNIIRLQAELADKQRSLTLCQVRLSNRAMRPYLELTCDIAQRALYGEMQQLQCSLVKLNQKLAENKAILRYMTHTQLMQEEEINIKLNTLKIDEVKCESMRKVLIYANF